MAEFHRESISTTGRPECWRLADAVSDVWRDAGGRLTARGLRLFSKDDGNVLVFWRSGGARTALLAAFADRFFAASGSAATIWRLVDPEGRPIAGAAAESGRPVARIIGTSEYPWTLQVWPPAPAPTGLRSGRTLLLTMMGAMPMFVWAASYSIGRAIRREAGVARLQSNFVAAVSHEFRSPLTAIRQMAEMLEMDRLPTDERRRTYYRTMAREAARLQRLVETLLNFGRMEAGNADRPVAVHVPGRPRSRRSDPRSRPRIRWKPRVPVPRPSRDRWSGSGFLERVKRVWGGPMPRKA